MTHTFEFATDTEARAFIEGVQFADTGTVQQIDLDHQADTGKWLVTVHRDERAQ